MQNFNKPRFVTATAHTKGEAIHTILDLATGEAVAVSYKHLADAQTEADALNAADDHIASQHAAKEQRKDRAN
jgi:hypothetical protein